MDELCARQFLQEAAPLHRLRFLRLQYHRLPQLQWIGWPILLVLAASARQPRRLPLEHQLRPMRRLQPLPRLHLAAVPATVSVERVERVEGPDLQAELAGVGVTGVVASGRRNFGRTPSMQRRWWRRRRATDPTLFRLLAPHKMGYLRLNRWDASAGRGRCAPHPRLWFCRFLLARASLFICLDLFMKRAVRACRSVLCPAGTAESSTTARHSRSSGRHRRRRRCRLGRVRPAALRGLAMCLDFPVGSHHQIIDAVYYPFFF